MDRRTFVLGLSSAAVVPIGAQAQTTERVYRVGYLAPRTGPLIELLIAALRERGSMVGRDLVFDIRTTQGDPARAEALTQPVILRFLFKHRSFGDARLPDLGRGRSDRRRYVGPRIRHRGLRLEATAEKSRRAARSAWSTFGPHGTR